MSLSTPKLLDRLVGGAVLRALRPLRAVRDLLGGDQALRAVREIAVVKFWGIGNAALLLPILRSLRQRYPGARLTVVTLADNESVYRPVADRVLGVRKGPSAATLLDLFRALAVLRRLRVDLALDFEQFVRTSQVLLFLARPQQAVAFDTEGQRRAGLADISVPYDDRRHCGESFLALARAVGLRKRVYRPGGLEVPGDAAERMDRWCRLHDVGSRPLVVLHPGSGDNFPGRRWPTRRFGLLGRRLVDEHGAVVAVTGGPAEAPLTREVVEASERDLSDLAGRMTLDELLALLARAALLVANDTGPVHLASALGVPVLGLYGPNTPRLYGPLSSGSVAFYDAPPCSPCITNLNYKTSRCRNPVCIRAIAVD
ncbi:MAG: glycosyltransferase family 9 protein, partial [Planctomycetota bacterium]